MRTRNKTTYTTTPPSTAKSWNNGAPYSTFSTFPGGDWPSLVESMTDEPTSPRGSFNPCTHEKWTGEILPATHVASWLTGYENRLDSYQTFHMARNAMGYGSSVAPAPPADWESYMEEAFQKMYPIQSDFSLVNDLLEIKDLKRLCDFWSQRHLKLLTGLHKPSKRRPLSHVRESLRNSANLHLNVEFGWLPLIRDVKSIVTILQKADEQFALLVKNAEKPLTRHYSRPLTERFSSGPTGQVSCGNSYFAYRETVTEQAIYHATMKYRYTVPREGKVMSNKVAYFLDRLGVRPDASIVWNAIPYSFCLDWVTNIGAWLQSLSPYNLALGLTIEGFCHSIKTKATSSLKFYSATPAYFARNDVVCTKETSEMYVRRTAVPQGVLNLRSRSPSRGAVTLGAALLLTHTL